MQKIIEIIKQYKIQIIIIIIFFLILLIIIKYKNFEVLKTEY